MESEPIVQKRILAIVSGAILPVVALGFIKSLVDYIRPEEKTTKAVQTADLEFLGEPVKENITKKEVMCTIKRLLDILIITTLIDHTID